MKKYVKPCLTRRGRLSDLTAIAPYNIVISDRAVKENVEVVDRHEVLEKLCAIPITTWNYLGQDPSHRHMGPMAQDFQSAFGLGDDDKHIHTVDASGVALVAIQELHDESKMKDAEIAELRREKDALARSLAAMESRLAELERRS